MRWILCLRVMRVFELKSDRDFILEAVKQDGRALRWASVELRDDEELVLEAKRQNGGALRWASAELRDDEELVLEAVKQDGRALQFASEALRGNRIVKVAAEASYHIALDTLSPAWREVVENNRFFDWLHWPFSSCFSCLHSCSEFD